jgi:hypothetical protein
MFGIGILDKTGPNLTQPCNHGLGDAWFDHAILNREGSDALSSR